MLFLGAGGPELREREGARNCAECSLGVSEEIWSCVDVDLDLRNIVIRAVVVRRAAGRAIDIAY